MTGYYFKTTAGQWADVTEDDAHAWVEYYIDGMGWQIMDATPAEVLNTQTQDQPQQEQPQSPSTGEEKTNTQDTNQPETAAPEPSQSDPEPQTEAPKKRLALWRCMLCGLCFLRCLRSAFGSCCF